MRVPAKALLFHFLRQRIADHWSDRFWIPCELNAACCNPFHVGHRQADSLVVPSPDDAPALIYSNRELACILVQVAERPELRDGFTETLKTQLAFFLEEQSQLLLQSPPIPGSVAWFEELLSDDARVLSFVAEHADVAGVEFKVRRYVSDFSSEVIQPRFVAQLALRSLYAHGWFFDPVESVERSGKELRIDDWRGTGEFHQCIPYTTNPDGVGNIFVERGDVQCIVSAATRGVLRIKCAGTAQRLSSNGTLNALSSRVPATRVCAQSADSPWYLHVRQKAARKRAVAVFAAIATMPTRGLNALRAALSSAYLRQLKQRATAAKLAKAKVATPQWPVTMLFAYSAVRATTLTVIRLCCVIV